MPARLIRDDLLESERVLSLPVEARWLYVAILLSADDVGLFEAAEFRLARRADIRREMLPTLLQALADQDLIRLYDGTGMRRLGFIPRFRQRLQIKRSKLPAPPACLYADDEDAVKKFNDLAAKTTVDHGDPPKSTVAHRNPPPEPEPEPEEAPSEQKYTPPAAPPAARAKPARLDAVRLLVADGVEPQVAADWMAIRRAKRLPLTPTAWEGVKREAALAGIRPGDAVRRAVESGWAGFKASWCAAPAPGEATPRPVNRMGLIEQHNRAVGARFLAESGVEGADA